MRTKSKALFEKFHIRGNENRPMPIVNGASLRDDFDAIKADFASLRKADKISIDVDVLIVALCRIVVLLIAVLLEKTTIKTDNNFTIADQQG